MGFMESVLSDRLLSMGQISDELRERYLMAVDDEILREVLNDLLEMGGGRRRGTIFIKRLQRPENHKSYKNMPHRNKLFIS